MFRIFQMLVLIAIATFAVTPAFAFDNNNGIARTVRQHSSRGRQQTRVSRLREGRADLQMECNYSEMGSFWTTGWSVRRGKLFR